MRFFQLVFILSFIYSQPDVKYRGSITSLLTPTGITVDNNGIVYASTAGGLLQFSPEKKEFSFIKDNQGLEYLDLNTINIDQMNRIWLGGAAPEGCLQVYDPSVGFLEYYFEDDLVSSINKIEISDSFAFAVYNGTTSGVVGILEFIIDENGNPDYKDYYENFSSLSITDIYDLDIVQDSIYVTTDQGIFAGKYTDDLKSIANWVEIFENNFAKQFIPGNSPIVISDGNLYKKENGVWESYCSFIGDVIQAEYNNNLLSVLTDEYYYEFNDCQVASFQVPIGNQNSIGNYSYDLRTVFTSFDYADDGSLYLGVNYNGIIHLDSDLTIYDMYIPDSPISNSFNAITITKSGFLAATSHIGTVYYDGFHYYNFIPQVYNRYFSNPSETFNIVGLDYNLSDEGHFPISIVEKENNHLIYCNSGVNPGYGPVVELDLINESAVKYGSTDDVIDGWDGIYIPDANTNYMIVNEIAKDRLGNIWITNPFCEKNGHLIAIQKEIDDNWVHIRIPDAASYRPQTIAIEELTAYNRVWIGLAYDNQEHILYSSGGIKVMKYNENLFQELTESDTSWIPIANPEVIPGDISQNVWSLAIDRLGFLWVLTDKGVQGYEIDGSSEITLNAIRKSVDENGIESPYNYLTYLSFVKGDRIRVDSQNNKWIITHHGVWVITESGTFWPAEDGGLGLHRDNVGLLSDKVYDVAFDNKKGLAYLSTAKGISILDIPFAENPSKKQSMYISPNPFIISESDYVRIGKVPAGSTIQILTITGLLIKSLSLESNENYTFWNGTDATGRQVGSAVYIVSSHHPSERNMVSKIAVIR